MVTADEIVWSPSSPASPRPTARLARAAADITLAPGEYAAHEEADRARVAI